MTAAEFRALCLSFPSVDESFSLGSAAFKTNGKVLARLIGDAEAQLTGVGADEIDNLIAAEPDIFHASQHLRDAGYIAVRLSSARPETLAALLERRFRDLAKVSVLKAWPGRG